MNVFFLNPTDFKDRNHVFPFYCFVFWWGQKKKKLNPGKRTVIKHQFIVHITDNLKKSETVWHLRGPFSTSSPNMSDLLSHVVHWRFGLLTASINCRWKLMQIPESSSYKPNMIQRPSPDPKAKRFVCERMWRGKAREVRLSLKTSRLITKISLTDRG